MSVGIYLPNMETPKDCLKCPFCLFADGYWKCLVDGSHADFGGTCRPSLCPLVPVPEHGRLIDADALDDLLMNLADNEYTPKVFASWLSYEENAPTIIEADESDMDSFIRILED